jgi:hypothetical protein
MPEVLGSNIGRGIGYTENFRGLCQSLQANIGKAPRVGPFANHHTVQLADIHPTTNSSGMSVAATYYVVTTNVSERLIICFFNVKVVSVYQTTQCHILEDHNMNMKRAIFLQH